MKLIFTTFLFSLIFSLFAQTTIRMERNSGVYIIPCKVNNLPLKFIFDTGASNVTISLTEAIFMLKNEYLNENDIIGTSYAELANGDITENTLIILRKVEFAGLTLYNVKASVVHEMSAPLLLGQSAISQLGKIQIDPATNTLTILNKRKNTYNYSQDNNIQSNKISTIFKDYDDNIYHSVTIGTQVWMKENLKTTHYNNGSEILLVNDAATWTTLSTPAYCWYNNDALNYKNKYGALYNWYTVNTGKLCPIGWHIPTDSEWILLVTYLEGENIAGGKLKEAGTIHWLSPNIGASNKSDFTALPGGYRNNIGTFLIIGKFGYWWSSPEYDKDRAWYLYMSYDYEGVYRSIYDEKSGFSVRCIKD